MDVGDSLDLQALVGRYVLHPGHAPSVTGQRGVLAPGLLAGLLRGHDLRQAQCTLGQLFTLCGHAHQRALPLAWRAVQNGHAVDEVPQSCIALALETARDHLRNMALDWPRHCGMQPDLRWLVGNPLPLHKAPLPSDPASLVALATRATTWLEPLLQSAPEAWLRASTDAPTLRQWCLDAAPRVPPAAMLHAWAQLPGLHAQRPVTQVLDVGVACTLPHVNQALDTDPAFSQRPALSNGCAETGPWWRHQPHAPGNAPVRTAWSRLAARWRDMVACIASAAAEQAHLCAGASPLHDRVALAWVEMARGLLLYRVALDERERIRTIQVVAPTEWNFHPQGQLACALQALSPDDTMTARLLALAWDACVECDVQDNSAP